MDRRIYLAIPYTGIEARSFEIANHASYEIIKRGDIPLSPISMSHPIVQASMHDGKYSEELLGSWEVWSKIDYSFINWAEEIWVVCIERHLVTKSIGVQAELKYGRDHGKTIRYIGLEYDGDIKEGNYKFLWPVDDYSVKTDDIIVY
jgi:hypothetical protein